MAVRPYQNFPGRVFFSSLYNQSYRTQVGSDFLVSSSAKLVNPHHHIASSDEVSWTLDTKDLRGMDDRKVLSLFSVGFFGGFVLGIERMLLTAGAWRLLPVHFTAFPSESRKSSIWHRSDIPGDDLCPTGTKLFGSFQLLDKQISKGPTNASTSTSSYVDYGFGSDTYSFSGCHRFRITRIPRTPENAKELVQISLEGFHCDPQQNRLWLPRIALWFHAAYARVLFANGMQSVLTRGAHQGASHQ
ncbi:hypothetical protein N7452_007857 [Penicillium brevicompactum]|uniref:Uncharacterized protein n=1 Tax=Penicillium brevicompactum TaxID=5074 RepID=A0A9W9QFZ8_PENBR|nr:hypothetical protein N7452_007857 [Penicillium brevicompactum]